MHPEDSRTSPRDARSAAQQERTHRRVRERCSPPFVPIAARSARCPSSLPRERQFTAASASLREERLLTDFLSATPAVSMVFNHHIPSNVELPGFPGERTRATWRGSFSFFSACHECPGGP